MGTSPADLRRATMAHMSFLYRVAMTITRKQPYLDWANGGADGPELTEQVAHDQRTVYLAPETNPDQPDLESMLDEFWAHIFEAELSAWNGDEEQWPSPRTRELFDAWFTAELTGSVYDLTPDEALTQADVEVDDLHAAMHNCAWCDEEVDEHAGRFVTFTIEDRTRLAHRAGLAVPIPIDDQRVVVGVMSSADSDAARQGEDIAFRACTGRCEKALRKAVPRALKAAFAPLDTSE